MPAQQPNQDQRRAEYKAYLASPIWREKRKVALERAEHRCQLCNSLKRLDVHHRTYERFGGDELPGDLTVLCRKCHEHFHGKRHVATPKWKNYGTPVSPQEREQMLVAMAPGRQYTTQELGQALQLSPQRTGTILQSLRKAGEVHKRNKRWHVKLLRAAPHAPRLQLVGPGTEKDKARQRVADAVTRMAPGEIYTTSAIAEMAEVSVSRTGGFLSGFARRRQGVEQLGNKRWRHPQVHAA